MSEDKKPKTRYRTTNWPQYNAALKARGSLTVWLDKDMHWLAEPSGKRGRGQIYSDAAIEFCLSIQCLFNQPLRQALGMVQSLLEIRAIEVTTDAIGDAPMLPELLAQIPMDEPIASVSGDGAYETQGCLDAIAQRGAQALIPPRKNARIWKRKSAGCASRNEAVQACKRFGWPLWKIWSGYHRRSLVETKMHCFKRLGERVMARTFERQVVELHIRVALLNRFSPSHYTQVFLL